MLLRHKVSKKLLSRVCVVGALMTFFRRGGGSPPANYKIKTFLKPLTPGEVAATADGEGNLKTDFSH